MSTTPAFRPSEVLLIVPPLIATMKHAEVEQAAAFLVFACTRAGDAWQPVTIDELVKAAEEAKSAAEPTPRQTWLLDMIRNPFVRPNFLKLIELGFAVKVANAGDVPQGHPERIELTPAGIAALAKWVGR